MDLIGKVLKTASGKFVQGIGKALALSDVIDFNTNVIRGIATATKTITIYISMNNNDTLVVRVGGTVYEQTFSTQPLSINQNLGDTISIIPKSGNWGNLSFISLFNIELDIAKESSKFSNARSIAITYGTIENPDLSHYGNPTYSISIQACTQHTGNLSDISNVSKYVNLYGQNNIAGNLSSINKNISRLQLTSPLIQGDLAHFSDMTVTSLLQLITLYDVTGELANLSNCYVSALVKLYNITGDISDLTYNISNKIPMTIENCPLITGNIDIMFGWIIPNGVTFNNMPLITGSFSSLYGFSGRIDCRNTNVYEYTTVPIDGFASNNIVWRDSKTPIPQDDLVCLIADKRLYVENNNQINGTINIGSNNVAITNAQALADIAYLETQGWTITYNT